MTNTNTTGIGQGTMTVMTEIVTGRDDIATTARGRERRLDGSEETKGTRHRRVVDHGSGGRPLPRHHAAGTVIDPEPLWPIIIIVVY